MADFMNYYRAWAAVVCVGFLFYAFVLYKLHTKRAVSPYNSAYYVLWRQLAVVDLFSTVVLWTLIKRPFVTGEPSVSITALIAEQDPTSLLYRYIYAYIFLIYPLTIWLVFMQYCMIFTMAVNLLTSVFFPLRYDIIWEKTVVKVATILPWMLSACAIVGRYLYSVAAHYDNPAEVRHMLTASIIPLVANIDALLIACTLFSSLLLVYKLWRVTGAETSSSAMTTGTGLLAKPEHRLTLNMIVLTAVMCFALAIGRATTVVPGEYILGVWLVSSDLFNLCNPFILLAVSASSRSLVFATK